MMQDAEPIPCEVRQWGTGCPRGDLPGTPFRFNATAISTTRGNESGWTAEIAWKLPQGNIHTAEFDRKGMRGSYVLLRICFK